MSNILWNVVNVHRKVLREEFYKTVNGSLNNSHECLEESTRTRLRRDLESCFLIQIYRNNF